MQAETNKDKEGKEEGNTQDLGEYWQPIGQVLYTVFFTLRLKHKYATNPLVELSKPGCHSQQGIPPRRLSRLGVGDPDPCSVTILLSVLPEEMCWLEKVKQGEKSGFWGWFVTSGGRAIDRGGEAGAEHKGVYTYLYVYFAWNEGGSFAERGCVICKLAA
jgi:hypothetical protein